MVFDHIAFTNAVARACQSTAADSGHAAGDTVDAMNMEKKSHLYSGGGSPDKPNDSSRSHSSDTALGKAGNRDNYD